MTYNWFKIFNKTDFEALDLVSRTYTVVLEGLGQKDILVTKGNYLSVFFEDTLLSINLNDRNPFLFEGYAVFLDENNDVWIGVLIED